jgi:pyruvate-formate lyase-activating enzyme
LWQRTGNDERVVELDVPSVLGYERRILELFLAEIPVVRFEALGSDDNARVDVVTVTTDPDMVSAPGHGVLFAGAEPAMSWGRATDLYRGIRAWLRVTRELIQGLA